MSVPCLTTVCVPKDAADHQGQGKALHYCCHTLMHIIYSLMLSVFFAVFACAGSHNLAPNLFLVVVLLSNT